MMTNRIIKMRSPKKHMPTTRTYRLRGLEEKEYTHG